MSKSLMEKKHCLTTVKLINALDKNEYVKTLVEKSILKASKINPDKKSNPAQTLEEFYDFIDFSLTRQPWGFFPEELFKGFAEKTDQSILYPYFLLDQPLDELKNENLFYNSVEYISPIREWLTDYCNAWKEFLDSEKSWCEEYRLMIFEEKTFNMDKGWYEHYSNWKTFNQFFARKLSSPSARPIDKSNDDSVVVAPADAMPQGTWIIDNEGKFHDNDILSEEGVTLKSSTFSTIEQLLGEEGKEYAQCFHGGTLTHTYLNYDDYHRYHFPVGGKIKAVYIVPTYDHVGGICYWSDKLGRYVLESNSILWQSYETRGCVIIETEEYGLVAVLPIGMGQVSSVNFEDNVKVGSIMKKGEPLGYFLFGGSDCVLVFQEKAHFKLTAPLGGEGTYSNGYAHIFQGQELGILNKN